MMMMMKMIYENTTTTTAIIITTINFMLYQITAGLISTFQKNITSTNLGSYPKKSS